MHNGLLFNFYDNFTQHITPSSLSPTLQSAPPYSPLPTFITFGAAVADVLLRWSVLSRVVRVITALDLSIAAWWPL